MNQDELDPAPAPGRSAVTAEHATPVGQAADEPAVGPRPSCLECGSSLVGPSQSAYPHDEVTRKGGEGSFWRCDNCGARFLGPTAPQRKRQRRRRPRDSEDGLSRRVNLSRPTQRIVFPIIVIASTIIAVIYILDQRSYRAEQNVIFSE